MFNTLDLSGDDQETQRKQQESILNQTDNNASEMVLLNNSIGAPATELAGAHQSGRGDKSQLDLSAIEKDLQQSDTKNNT